MDGWEGGREEGGDRGKRGWMYWFGSRFLRLLYICSSIGFGFFEGGFDKIKSKGRWWG